MGSQRTALMRLKRSIEVGYWIKKIILIQARAKPSLGSRRLDSCSAMLLWKPSVENLQAALLFSLSHLLNLAVMAMEVPIALPRVNLAACSLTTKGQLGGQYCPF